jgi:hypothetical protein
MNLVLIYHNKTTYLLASAFKDGHAHFFHRVLENVTDFNRGALADKNTRDPHVRCRRPRADRLWAFLVLLLSHRGGFATTEHRTYAF